MDTATRGIRTLALARVALQAVTRLQNESNILVYQFENPQTLMMAEEVESSFMAFGHSMLHLCYYHHILSSQRVHDSPYTTLGVWLEDNIIKQLTLL